MDPKTEADDLIAYYVQNRKPNEKIVIATTDMDISQYLQEQSSTILTEKSISLKEIK